MQGDRTLTGVTSALYVWFLLNTMIYAQPSKLVVQFVYSVEVEVIWTNAKLMV